MKRLIFDMMDGRKVMPNNELRLFSLSLSHLLWFSRMKVLLFFVVRMSAKRRWSGNSVRNYKAKTMKNYRMSEQLEICAHTVIMLFPCDPKIRYDRLNGLMNFLLLNFGSPSVDHNLNALYVTWWLGTIFKLLWLDDNKRGSPFLVYLWFASRGRNHNYFFPWICNL